MEDLSLQVEELNAWYRHHSSDLFSRKQVRHQVLFDINIKIKQGEILGLVGESGTGKSTLVKTLLGMVTDYEGRIIHHTQRPQMVFQDPYNSLNPARSIGWILEEPLKNMGIRDAKERHRRAEEMLTKVGLSADFYSRRPAALSGGQRQRVAIAAALMSSSKLIFLDEPLSALDVTVQAQMIELLLDLREKFGLSYLLISHDLNVVYQMCDRVAIMTDGQIVETGTVEEIYEMPKHNYTKQLLNAALDFA